MSSAEFAEWMAYDRHDPIGGLRGDIQAAIIARTIAAVFAGEQAPKTSEFLPEFWTPEEEEEDEEGEASDPAVLQSKINAAMIALGGRPKPPPKEA